MQTNRSASWWPASSVAIRWHGESRLGSPVVICSLSFCRWFGECRDIGGAPSSSRRLYDTDIDIFQETTTCYTDEFTFDRWNAPCHFIQVKERIHAENYDTPECKIDCSPA